MRIIKTFPRSLLLCIMTRRFRPTMIQRKQSPTPPVADKVTKSAGYLINNETEGTEHIDLEDIRRIIKRFRIEHNTPVIELIKNKDEDYFKLIHFVALLKETDSYPLFENCIREEHRHLKSHIKIGTIGNYIFGCFINLSTSGPDRPCTVACSGSIPRSDQSGKTPKCDYPVVLSRPLTKNSKFIGYNFEVRDPSVINKRIYLYIENCNFLNRFHGLNHTEKNTLRKMGVKEIELYGYYNSNSVKLLQQPITLNTIKTRVEETHLNNKIKGNVDKDLNTMYIMLIVVIVVIIITIGAYMLNKQSAK